MTVVAWKVKKSLEQWRLNPPNFFSGKEGIANFCNGLHGRDSFFFVFFTE
jgi:hypothetical protein